jgi:hypothetical protein
MASVSARLLFVLAAALVGCASPTYRIAALSKDDLKDPLLVAPGTRGEYGGSVWVPLPEFKLESGRSLTLNLDVPGSGIVILSLEEKPFGLEAHLPMSTYVALAGTSQLEEVIHAALKGQGQRLRFLRGDQALATEALAVTLAQRLPRKTSNTLKDLFAFDPDLRSIALAPGMRLRLEGMLPVTADVERLSDERSQGSITAPSYLYTSSPGDGTSASITLSPALSKLGVDAKGNCDDDRPAHLVDYDCKRWADAGGLSDLIGAQWRYWTLLYPKSLGAVRAVNGDGLLQFVHEELNPTEGPPAVLLVATSNGADMAAFMVKAREQLGKASSSASTIQAAKVKWREALRVLDDSARVAGLSIKAVFQAARTNNLPLGAVSKAFEKERAAYALLEREVNNSAIDCKINPPQQVAGCYVLRYRVLPVPEILVTVQGVQRWVELGSTVGMVLAPMEPMRATRPLAVRYDSNIEEWRNAAARIRADRVSVYRLFEGGRHAMEVQPGSPPDAIRNVVLQPGDEIQWSN